jgi:hypothetical protein
MKNVEIHYWKVSRPVVPGTPMPPGGILLPVKLLIDDVWYLPDWTGVPDVPSYAPLKRKVGRWLRSTWIATKLLGHYRGSMMDLTPLVPHVGEEVKFFMQGEFEGMRKLNWVKKIDGVWVMDLDEVIR